jgi:hypothetical protein
VIACEILGTFPPTRCRASDPGRVKPCQGTRLVQRLAFFIRCGSACSPQARSLSPCHQSWSGPGSGAGREIVQIVHRDASEGCEADAHPTVEASHPPNLSLYLFPCWLAGWYRLSSAFMPCGCSLRQVQLANQLGEPARHGVVYQLLSLSAFHRGCSDGDLIGDDRILIPVPER